MKVNVFCSKIHRATVTDANLNYIGSITIDKALVDMARMHQYQIVYVSNLRNGVMWRTYIMHGEANKGEICLNGPPSHHFQKGDLIILYADTWVEEEKLDWHFPTILFVDENNKPTKVIRNGFLD